MIKSLFEKNRPMGDIEKRFWDFHEKNSEVYGLFKRLALTAIKEGRDRLSANLIYNRIRWDFEVATTDKHYKLNSHYAAYYSRLFMDDYPEHKGFFETRRLKGR